MSDIDYHGNEGVILEDPGTLVTDLTSLQTCSAVFTIRKDRWLRLPSIGARHPMFTFMAMEHRELSFKGPFAVAECKYAGIQLHGEHEFTPPVYELVTGVSERAIATHPDFVTYIGGTPKMPQHGAIFEKTVNGTSIPTNGSTPASTDDGYTFREFAFSIEGKPNPFRKVESYLEAGEMTWRKTYNGRAATSAQINRVGMIDTPDGPAPTLTGFATWLNMGLSSTPRGAARQYTQEWRASGRGGWIPAIYSR